MTPPQGTGKRNPAADSDDEARPGPTVAFLMQERERPYGAERAVLDLLTALAAGGEFRPRMIFIRDTRAGEIGEVASLFREAGIGVAVLPVGKRFSFSLVRRVFEWLRRENAAVLHTIGNKADFHGAMAARWAGVPHVATVHGWLFRPDLRERLYEWLDRMVLRRCRRVVVLSRFYEKLLREAGVISDRLVRIPTGYPQARIPSETAAEARPSSLVLGYMGRFSEEKDPAAAVRVLARVRSEVPEARLVLAGEGPQESRIRQVAAALGVEHAVEFAGYVVPEELLPRISVLICTSWIENLPVSIMEAMAFRRPVAAYAVGGVPDLVENAVTGYLLPPGDEQGMASVLTGLARDGQRAVEMGRRGLAKLQREFSLEECVKRHVALYRSCAGAGGAA